MLQRKKKVRGSRNFLILFILLLGFLAFSFLFEYTLTGQEISSALYQRLKQPLQQPEVSLENIMVTFRMTEEMGFLLNHFQVFLHLPRFIDSQFDNRVILIFKIFNKSRNCINWIKIKVKIFWGNSFYFFTHIYNGLRY